MAASEAVGVQRPDTELHGRVTGQYHDALDAFAETYNVDFERPEFVVEEDASYAVVTDFPRGDAADLQDDEYILINDPEHPEDDDDHGGYYLPGEIRAGVDREEYAIRYGERDIAWMSEKQFALDVQLKMQMHYDMALREAMEPLRADLLEAYDGFDPAIPVRGAAFYGGVISSRQMAVIGELNYVLAGLDLMPALNPETGTFRCHPRAEMVDDEVPWIERASYHELVHPLHRATGRENAGAVSSIASAETEDHEERTHHIMRAASEALTTFEEYLRYGGGGRGAGRHEAYTRSIDAPLRGLKNLLEMEYDDGKQELEDPYRFALFAGLSVLRAFEEEYGEGGVYEERGRPWRDKWRWTWEDRNDHLFEAGNNKPLDLTREYLLTCATTPVGMLGAAQQAFRMRGLDEVAELLEEHTPVEEWMEDIAAVRQNQTE